MRIVALRFDVDAATPTRGPTRCSTPARCRSTSPIRAPAPPTRRRCSASRASRAARGGRRRASDRAVRRPTRTRDRARATRRGRLGVPLPPHETLPRSPSRTGCARRRRSSRRSAIARRLWIVPSWCEPPDRGAINLVLDPGLAFGTGSHPTTRLCLAWLRERSRGGERVLDYGCGSGILAIAAAKLGAARRASASTSIRRRSTRARANARANGVAATFVAARCARARRASTSSSPTSSPIRCIMLAPAARARVRERRAHRAVGHPRRSGGRRVRGVRALVYTRAVAHGRRLGALAARARLEPPGTRRGRPSNADHGRRKIHAVPRLRDDLPGHCRAARAARRAGALRALPDVFDGSAQLISLAPPARAEDERSVRRVAAGPPTVTLRNAQALDPRTRTPTAAPPRRAATRAPALEADADDDATAGVDYDSRFAWDRPRPATARRCAGVLHGRHSACCCCCWSAQALFHFRDALAAHWPATRPLLIRHVRGCRLRDPAAARHRRAVDRCVRPAGGSRAQGTADPDGDDPQPRGLSARLSVSRARR